MRADVRRLFGWMTAFYVAMAFLESAVVVYLRALYYPTGFEFPLAPMDRSLVTVEVFREAATILMLLAPAALVTRSGIERFAWFCFGFGVWDIFYYVWLKVMLGWPSSLMSRDLLFLIPVPWVGPVWAPCAVSLGLIAFALLVLFGRSRVPDFRVDGWSWALLGTSALLVMVSFTIDPLLQHIAPVGVNGLAEASSEALVHGRDYVPEHFPWPWFVAGVAGATAAFVRLFRACAPGNTAFVEKTKPLLAQPR